MEQKIATHQLTQVKTMIRKNYNTKNKKICYNCSSYFDIHNVKP